MTLSRRSRKAVKLKWEEGAGDQISTLASTERKSAEWITSGPILIAVQLERPKYNAVTASVWMKEGVPEGCDFVTVTSRGSQAEGRRIADRINIGIPTGHKHVKRVIGRPLPIPRRL